MKYEILARRLKNDLRKADQLRDDTFDEYIRLCDLCTKGKSDWDSVESARETYIQARAIHRYLVRLTDDAFVQGLNDGDENDSTDLTDI